MDQSLGWPPDDPGDADPSLADWKTEWDVTVTLQKLGHEVHSLGVMNELAPLRTAIWEKKPHVVFNLLEDFQDVPIYDQNVVAFLELSSASYTGCNPRGLMLAPDKAISKTLLAHYRIPVPELMVVPRGRKARPPRRMTYPVIVKSRTKEGSEGIALSSVVDGDEKLGECVRFAHERVGTDAIVERYVHGRELYVGILGNERLKVLPIWEILLGGLADSAPRIASAKVKWDPKYQEKHQIESRAATDLDDALVRRIRHICRRTYRILHLSGYARIDLRLDESGQPFVIEATRSDDLRAIARASCGGRGRGPTRVRR
ncbi:MAG: D-alanine--D-alanine ligase [Acidobacteriota bacterium]